MPSEVLLAFSTIYVIVFMFTLLWLAQFHEIAQMKERQLTHQELDILRYLKENGYFGQRMVSESTGYSIGLVNKSLKVLTEKNLVDEDMRLTQSANVFFAETRPRNAVILAAGFGMRMVPINLSTPKAFLEVKGERLIERLIRQLHDAGIVDITVVTGFMKESFEYLIDEYGIDIIVNEKYGSTNNLYSLALAGDRLSNTYIIPCDIWCRDNPFRQNELYSWYMVSDKKVEDSDVRVNRKMQLVRVDDNEQGNSMIGICYLLENDALSIAERVRSMVRTGRYENAFWEEALYRGDRMSVISRVVSHKAVIEVNTYEQLRDLDSDSDQLRSEEISTIAAVFKCSENDITDIRVLKKGMTNRSFLFSVFDQKYIMRIPGEGTDQLIDRRQEADVFTAIRGLGLCDDPVYIEPERGYKITAYLDNIRVCDPYDESDLRKCMNLLRSFHQMRLTVEHEFDIFKHISFYESLWEGTPSVYRDYEKTRDRVFSLREYIDRQDKDWCLTHIDAVNDNFLFYSNPDGIECLQLTDWEYAGMQDPHVDIAMFCIYSLYSKQNIDRLIDIYFDGKCDNATRAKIYCYISACGLLWSNWCEFKRKLGVEFGEYSLRQYRYAKDFYKYATEIITEYQ